MGNKDDRERISLRLPKAEDFTVVWVCSAISTVGTRTLGVAYPLLALQQTRSPADAGWTAFALMIPVLVLYIPGGFLVDWISSRLVMLLAEFGRWMTVSSVLVAMFFGGPTLPHLITAALIEGILWTFYNLAETTLVPSLVRSSGVWRAMAKTEGASHLASLTGRPLGGYLFGVGSYIPFTLNAALFGLSWGLLFDRLRGHEWQRRKIKLWKETVQGFRFLKGQEFLRAAIVLISVTNLLVNTLIMIIIVEFGDGSSLLIGLVLAAGGLGGGVGALVAFYRRPARHALLLHTWIWVLALSVGLVGAVLGADGEAWPYFSFALFATGVGGAMSNVAIRAVEAVKIDPEMLARVVGVSRLSSYGALCCAAPLGGLLVTWNGVEGGMAVLSGGMLVLALLVTFVSSWRRRMAPQLPELSDGAAAPDAAEEQPDGSSEAVRPAVADGMEQWSDRSQVPSLTVGSPQPGQVAPAEEQAIVAPLRGSAPIGS